MKFYLRDITSRYFRCKFSDLDKQIYLQKEKNNNLYLISRKTLDLSIIFVFIMQWCCCQPWSRPCFLPRYAHFSFSSTVKAGEVRASSSSQASESSSTLIRFLTSAMAGLFAGKLIKFKNLNVDRYLHLQYIRINNHRTSSEFEDSEFEDSGFVELSDELNKR